MNSPRAQDMSPIKDKRGEPIRKKPKRDGLDPIIVVESHTKYIMNKQKKID